MCETNPMNVSIRPVRELNPKIESLFRETNPMEHPPMIAT
jgi:hypothetical protein